MDNYLINSLVKLGLTKGEAKVYLALSYLHESRLTPLIKKSKVSSSKIKEILTRLSFKGLVCEKHDSDVKIFKFLGTDKLKDLLKNLEEEVKIKKQILNKIIPMIKTNSNFLEKEGDVQILEGMEGFKSAANNIISVLEKGDTFYLIFGGDLQKYFPYAFFDEWQKRRIKKGIKLKALYPKIFNKPKLPLTQIRYVDEGVVSPITIGIGKSFVGHMIIKPSMKTTVLFGKTISENYIKYFENLWNNFSKD